MSIESGFDRGIDFKDMKEQLIKAYNRVFEELPLLDEDDRYYTSKKRKIMHKLIYIMVSMMQLFNGSRISEACIAFALLLGAVNIEDKVISKIAKSESIKYKKDGEQYTTKARYRYLIFPVKWIQFPIDIKEDLAFYVRHMLEGTLKKRVLDYLLKYHNCNTHSLRYAYINYMLYTQKKEPSLVAKHVGHSSMAQLVRYTQRKESDKFFDMDI
ncbi:MAG TPA: hypothetical protein VK590_16220 [Saprospiraceae bacterium]|nr:hypothetical protein [Saprospiraceae bacterium]